MTYGGAALTGGRGADRTGSVDEGGRWRTSCAVQDVRHELADFRGPSCTMTDEHGHAEDSLRTGKVYLRSMADGRPPSSAVRPP